MGVLCTRNHIELQAAGRGEPGMPLRKGITQEAPFMAGEGSDPNSAAAGLPVAFQNIILWIWLSLSSQTLLNDARLHPHLHSSQQGVQSCQAESRGWLGRSP